MAREPAGVDERGTKEGQDFMKRAPKLMLLVLVASLAAWSISLDPGIAYNLPNGTNAGYNTVGIPFEVNKNITISSLGAYDLNFNGLPSGTTITVGIYSFTPNSASPPDLSSATPSVSATLNSYAPSAYGSVWTSVLDTPLVPGWYMAVATIYNSSDYFISGMNTGGTALQTWNGAVSYGYLFPGVPGLYGIAVGTNGQLTNWLWSTSAPVHISGATFSIVPEPSTYALMASVGLALYFLRRRRNQAAKN